MAASGRGSEPFPWQALKGPVGRGTRTRVVNATRALLAWQERLARWPRVSHVPDATPFVSLYANGRLTGCFGSMEGAPGERLVRAFVSALEDQRYVDVDPKERGALTACVSYLRAPRHRALGEIERDFALGTEGLAAVVRGKAPTLLLPSVAIDERASISDLLHLLARKLEVTPSDLARATLYTFEADAIVVRPVRALPRAHTSDPVEAAATWLAAQVDSAGCVRFAVDARTRTEYAKGEFMHGRAAAVVQALTLHGGFPRQVARARRWLRAEARAAIGGRRIANWPKDVAGAAGTIALAVLAGVDLANDLAELAVLEPLKRNPWHAAQVVTALGKHAPPSLWQACVANLREEPWAPWTALAARALGDRAVFDRVTDVLAASIRSDTRHSGAANVTRVPEVALTAVATEALASSRSSLARAARIRAKSFLLSMQFKGERIPAALDPAMAHGAFPLSCADYGLRSDVTAHTLLALLGQW